MRLPTLIASLGSLLILPIGASFAATPAQIAAAAVAAPDLQNGCHIRRYRYQSTITFKMFASTVECNFTKAPNANAAVDALSDKDLAILSSLYERTNSKNMAPLAEIFAQRLDVKHLLRVKAAMGATEMDKAVAAKASAAVQGPYFAAVNPKPLPQSHALFQSQGITATAGLVVAAPTLDYTLYEIYLDYLTSGLTVQAATAMAATYVARYTLPSFTVGYAIGTVVYNFVDWVAPSVTITIGDVEGGIVEGVVGSSDGTGGVSKR